MKLILKQLLSLVLVFTLVLPSTVFAQQRLVHTLDTSKYKNAELAEAVAMQLTNENFVPERIISNAALFTGFVGIWASLASHLTAFMIAANSNVNYSPTYRYLTLSEVEILNEGEMDRFHVNDAQESRLRDYLRIRHSELSQVELPSRYGEPRIVKRIEIFSRFPNLDQLMSSMESHFKSLIGVKPSAYTRNGPLGLHYLSFDFKNAEIFGKKSIDDNQIIEAVRCLQYSKDPIRITKNAKSFSNLLDAILTFDVHNVMNMTHLLDDSIFDEVNYPKVKSALMIQRGHEISTKFMADSLRETGLVRPGTSPARLEFEAKLHKAHNAALQERILKRTNQNVFKASVAALVITAGMYIYYISTKDTPAEIDFGDKYNIEFEDTLPMAKEDKEQYRVFLRESENFRISQAMIADALKAEIRKSTADLQFFDAYNAQFKKLN